MADNVRFTAGSLASGDIVWMSPKQYLDLSPSMKDPDSGKQAEELRASFSRGEGIRTTPSLKIDGGAVTAQDGRHRALAAQRAGIRMIPVEVDGEIPKDGKLLGMMGRSVQLDASMLTPPQWDDIARDKSFKRMSPDEKEAARRDYLNQVILPRASKADEAKTRDQFMRESGMRVPPTMRADPTEGMGAIEGARANAGRVMTDTWQGLEQLVGAAGPADVRAKRALDAPLDNAPGATAGKIIGGAGVGAPAALVPGANTAIGATLLGGGLGAIQPAEDSAERVKNALTGGATSGLFTLGARAAPAIYHAVADPFLATGRDRIALDILGRFAKDPNAIANLKGPFDVVPGSPRPLSEVTGDPGIAQLERAAQANHPEVANAFYGLKQQRMAARRDALLGLAGTDGEKKFYEAARDATAKRLYGDAFKSPLDPAEVTRLQPQVKALLQRPSIQAAQAGAVRIAKEEGANLSPKKLAAGSIEGMHYMKKALDSQIAKARVAGDDAEVKRLVDTQSKLVGLMDQLSPAYRDARAEYAAASKPINRMEVMGALYDKLVPALTDLGAMRENPGRYAEALKAGDEVAKRVTGLSGAKLQDILAPDEWNTVIAVGKDLGSQAWALDAARVPGSPTAQFLAARNASHEVAGAAGVPRWLQDWTFDTLSKRMPQLLEKSRTEKLIGARLGDLLTDPSKAAAAAAERQAHQNSLTRLGADFWSRRLLAPAAVGGGNALVNP
jgi:hypothetical protein